MGEKSFTHPPWHHVTLWLVCVLTLAASGDDVCLPRVLVPSLPAEAVSLDDPNADFTASADSSEIRALTLLHQPADAAPAILLLALSHATSSLRLAFEADSFRPCAAITTSLRC